MDVNSLNLELYPGLAAWWQEASTHWREHRSARSPETLLERVDYHGGLSRQFSVAEPRVVYTTSGSTLAAAIVEDPSSVIDTSLYWARVHSLDEGHYLTAVLNSSTVLEQVAEYQPIGAFGRRHFHKHVFEVPIPRFSPSDSTQADLATTGRRAAELAESVDIEGLSFVSARNRIREVFQHEGLGDEIEALVRELF